MRRTESRRACRGGYHRIHQCRGMEVLEPKLPLAADLLLGEPPPEDPPVESPPPPPPGLQLRYTFVDSPTATDNGEVAQLPQVLAQTHEWAPYHLEVWVKLDGETSIAGHEIQLDLGYRTDLTSATQIEFGQHFLSNQEVELDDAAGQVRGISVTTAADPANHSGHLLLARIRFETVVANGDDVPLDSSDVTGGGVGPYDIELTTQQWAVQSADTTTQVSIADDPVMKLVPVIYDLSGSHSVSIQDFNLFISQYGKTAHSPADGLAWFADFNKDNRVGIADFHLLISHFGRSNGSEVHFPENYTAAWVPTEMEGEDGGGSGQNPQDPPPQQNVPRFELDALANLAPGIFLPGAEMVFILLVGHVNFQAGFDVSRLTAVASMSEDPDKDEEISVATLSIILEDDELYEMEIEISFEGELIDTILQFEDWGGFIVEYTSQVMIGVRELLLDSFNE